LRVYFIKQIYLKRINSIVYMVCKASKLVQLPSTQRNKENRSTLIPASALTHTTTVTMPIAVKSSTACYKRNNGFIQESSGPSGIRNDDEFTIVPACGIQPGNVVWDGSEWTDVLKTSSVLVENMTRITGPITWVIVKTGSHIASRKGCLRVFPEQEDLADLIVGSFPPRTLIELIEVVNHGRIEDILPLNAPSSIRFDCQCPNGRHCLQCLWPETKNELLFPILFDDDFVYMHGEQAFCRGCIGEYEPCEGCPREEDCTRYMRITDLEVVMNIAADEVREKYMLAYLQHSVNSDYMGVDGEVGACRIFCASNAGAKAEDDMRLANWLFPETAQIFAIRIHGRMLRRLEHIGLDLNRGALDLWNGGLDQFKCSMYDAFTAEDHYVDDDEKRYDKTCMTEIETTSSRLMIGPGNLIMVDDG
jgi:hypothetical protein